MLTSLLERFQCLTTLRAGCQQIVNPLAIDISLGLCKNLRELHIGGNLRDVFDTDVLDEIPRQALDCVCLAWWIVNYMIIRPL